MRPASLPGSIAKYGAGHFPKKLEKMKCGVNLCIEQNALYNFIEIIKYYLFSVYF